MKENSLFNVDVVSTDFNDLIVFRIRGSNCFLAAVYLPPIESKYYSSDYFDALDLVCHTFSNSSQFYVFGDFNSRIGTPASSRTIYQPNPDLAVNSHGNSLLDIIHRQTLSNRPSTLQRDQISSVFSNQRDLSILRSLPSVILV